MTDFEKDFTNEEKEIMKTEEKIDISSEVINLINDNPRKYLTIVGSEEEVKGRDKVNQFLLKQDFLDLVKDKKHSEASEVLVEYIKQNNYIYTTKDDNKTEMWIYRDGIYTPNGKSEVKAIMREILGKHFSAYYYNLVMNKLEPDTFIEIDKFFTNNYINEIPVLNGILNLKTRELKDFCPTKIFFNKLQVTYNTKKECHKIDKFLKDVLADEEDKNVFYEIGGFCLLKEYKFEKAFMFVGGGRNGKDKTLELIKRLLGIHNCCSVPLSSLIPDSFIISEFFGKMANLAGDINNRDLKDTSTFKALTGRSLMSAPRKFLNAITFENYAKFIFACNHLPMVYDDSKGFWDRWVLLEFPYTFVPKSELENADDKTNLKIRDEDIINKITSEDEMSGLLNKCLDGLDRLNKHREFSSTKGSKDIKDIWIKKSNSFMAFCFDMIEDEYDSYVTKKELRKLYSNYCKIHKIKQMSDYVIKRTLEELFGVIESYKSIDSGNGERVWEGIKLKVSFKDLQDFAQKRPHFENSLTLIEVQKGCKSCEFDDTFNENCDKNVIKEVSTGNDGMSEPIQQINISDETTEKCSLNDKNPQNTKKIEKISKLDTWFPDDDPEAEVELSEMLDKGVKEAEIEAFKCTGELYESRPGFLRRLR